MPSALGRRLPDNSDLKALERPGDYFLGAIDDHGVIRPRVWFLLPTADPADPWERRAGGTREEWVATRHNGLHGVESPPWTFTEQPDGSLEVRASILCGARDPEGAYFHGHLNAGHQWTWD